MKKSLPLTGFTYWVRVKIKAIFLLALICVFFNNVTGQITYDWLNTAPDGNWRQGLASARWNPGGLFDEPPVTNIIRFNNNERLAMNNNVPGTYNIHQLIFGNNNDIDRTISGNPIRFFDFGGNNPIIENRSSGTHTISVNIQGDGDNGDPLEINPRDGDLILTGNINNQGSPINVTGPNGYTLSISGAISGSGGFFLQQSSAVILSGNNSYTGSTTISDGDLQISSATALTATTNLVFNGPGILSFSTPANTIITTGTIDIQTNGSTSIILGNNNNFSLTFANSSAMVWDPLESLTITNWSPGSNKKIYVAGAGLTTAQLDQISFAGYGIGAKFNGTELVPKFLYITQPSGAGMFSNIGSWVGSMPVLNNGTEIVYIQSGFNLTQNSTFNLLRLEIAATATLTMNAVNPLTIAASSGTIQNSGTITMVNGSIINMSASSGFRNSGSVNMTSNGSIINMAASAYWINTGGGFSGASGTVNFLGAGTVTTTTALTFPNVTIAGAVNFGSNSSINSTCSLTINNGGSIVTNGPNYLSGSALIYNTVTVFPRGLEWATGTSGKGVPANVTVNSGTTLNFANGNVSGYCNENLIINGALTMGAMTNALTVNENIDINGTLTFSTVSGGDLYINGNYTVGITGIVTNNDRAVFFTGSNLDQLITKTGGGTASFGYLIINNSNVANIQLNNTDVSITSTINNIGLYRLQLLNGSLDLNGRTFTLNSTVANATNIWAAGFPSTIFSSSGTGTLALTGTPTVSTPNTNVAAAGGSLLFDNTITVTTNVGVNFGGGISLIDGTFQINTNGFVINNAPDYGNNSTLIYNTGGNFNRNLEWNSIAAIGYPNHIIVQNNTTLDLNTAFAAPTIGCSGNFTVQSSSSVTMAAMANDITVTGNFLLNGSFTMSNTNGADLYLNGNWNRSATGVFNAANPRDRAVYLTGGNTTITAVGGESFPYLRIQKTANSNTVTLNDPVTVTNEVSFTTGVVLSSATDLFIMADNATYLGGSTNSFVAGPLRKVGNDAFVFPVGKIVGVTNTNHFRTIAISAPANTTDAFDAEFLRANPRLLGSVVSPLVRVSACEYWTLNRTTGGSNVFVTLSWSAQSPCNGRYVSDLTTLVVAHNDGAVWTTRGQSTNFGSFSSGIVTSAAAVSTFSPTFSPFALGTEDPGENLLPFVLLKFEGQLKANDIELNFAVKGNNEQKKYTIEKSGDGLQFTFLTELAAKANLSEAAYTAIDLQPIYGWNYYRLTATNLLGQNKQSQIIRIWFGNRIGKPAVFPNPIVSNQINLSTNGLAKGTYNLQLVSTDGKQMLNNRWVFDGMQPMHTIQLNSTLPSGIYWLVISNQNQEAVRIKILK